MRYCFRVRIQSSLEQPDIAPGGELHLWGHFMSFALSTTRRRPGVQLAGTLAVQRAVRASVEQLENRLLLTGSAAQLPPYGIISPTYAKSSDSMPPSASATAPNVFAAGGISYTFTVTYQSTVPVV